MYLVGSKPLVEANKPNDLVWLTVDSDILLVLLATWLLSLKILELELELESKIRLIQQGFLHLFYESIMFPLKFYHRWLIVQSMWITSTSYWWHRRFCSRISSSNHSLKFQYKTEERQKRRFSLLAMHKKIWTTRLWKNYQLG